ncbi:peptidylglycine monooxygenase [Parapedobacter defluvii]|uniref:Peptidylglycine monooxygenase n=1 Tax=Parapedobacter defluvii TaxID=2045106 RepID=A0ABQ1L229_9SPHI|nr:6-bladed beta-propeller [Parapedobacter defluvii]GGC15171.1 peptidylglycine monooxygenase [Parapedobacter defluvii]
MNRRTFIGHTAIGISAMAVKPVFSGKNEAPLYGHNGRTYRQVKGWGELDASRFPVKDCHEMVQDSKGRIFLLTNETRNNVLIYNTRGKLIDSWGKEYPGAHGLTIAGKGKDEFLLITDTERHEVYKTTLDGKLLMTLDFPETAGLYEKKEAYIPTETTVAPNGDIYVADGYGQQYILHYSADGKLKGWFGGRGEGDKFLDNAHGICVDQRSGDATLLITDRTRCCFKRFTMAGELLEIINVPGACVCRPVIHGDLLYAAVLRSPDMNNANSGFVTILDKENRVISNIGGSEPIYRDGKLQPLSQQPSLFKHPHDVCVDRDENIYVAQWASGNVYPYKFERV